MDFKTWIDQFVDKGADPTKIDDIPSSGGGTGDSPYVFLDDLSEGQHYYWNLSKVAELLNQKHPGITLNDVSSEFEDAFDFLGTQSSSVSFTIQDLKITAQGYITSLAVQSGEYWITVSTDECSPEVHLNLKTNNGGVNTSIAWTEGIDLDTPLIDAVESGSLYENEIDFKGFYLKENGFTKSEILSMLEVK